MPRFSLRSVLAPFLRPQPSPHPGMGAVLYGGGVSFRVWAPHASAVFVAGDFDGWRFDRHPLAAEGNGYWSAEGNRLTMWPDDPSKPPVTKYFRIWDERNNSEPSGWRRKLRKLGTCGDDRHLCEEWYVKE